jgi:hypothetical protein
LEAVFEVVGNVGGFVVPMIRSRLPAAPAPLQRALARLGL